MNDTIQSHSLDAITFSTLNGTSTIKFSDYAGKVVLVVNTASECGLTGQYKDLEALYQRYHAKGLAVLGVPCNDFGGQEPGSSSEIAQFCEKNYEVTFPLTEKVHVIGANAHPFYKEAENILGAESVPKWNFHKYLINRDGQLTHHFESKLEPMDTQIISAIESALG